MNFEQQALLSTSLSLLEKLAGMPLYDHMKLAWIRRFEKNSFEFNSTFVKELSEILESGKPLPGPVSEQRDRMIGLIKRHTEAVT